MKKNLLSMFCKEIIFILLILSFLLFSFYPTIFELANSDKIADPNREFILEHNTYWPDFNLYLSKIRQGQEGRITALEKYTSEPHNGSLIQIFYTVLGQIGKKANLDSNMSYQLGRIILAPLLLTLILFLSRIYFKKFAWQVICFIVTVASAGFPRFYTDAQGVSHIGRFLEWWSTIDALQRITFIPHILFGQIVSFFLLYQLTIKTFKKITLMKILALAAVGFITGLVFPPSLITLCAVLSLLVLEKLFRQFYINFKEEKHTKAYLERILVKTIFSGSASFSLLLILFVSIASLSLLYFFLLTKEIPWAQLVDINITMQMPFPVLDLIAATGPILPLGAIGGMIILAKKERKFLPLVLWVIATCLLMKIIHITKYQSPLRFTETGLFIPLGILGTYLLFQIWTLISSISKQKNLVIKKLAMILKPIAIALLLFYIFENLFVMKLSMDWEVRFVKDRLLANLPPVPYPPITLYPLKNWMEGVHWLKDNTKREDVILAEFTAGSYIPAYAGNTVYLGQANTYDLNRKFYEVDKFFTGKMDENEVKTFLARGKIKYIFFSIQEREKSVTELENHYPFLRRAITLPLVTIYKTPNSNNL